MRKGLFILLLFLPLTLWGQNYYVAAPPLGSDATGTGSPDTPWATLSYACGQVHLAGSVINLMTDITDNNRANLDARVSVTGMGTKKITTNYVATSTSDAYLRLYSSSRVNGNQSISYIHIDGNNLTATRAIWVGYRSNVSIHHCTIEDFGHSGIHFRNQIGWTTPPVTYATGNTCHDNTFINCSYMHATDPHQLRLDGQDGMLVYANVFDQRQRPAGQNGKNISWTNVQNIKLYSNTFYRNSIEVVADGTYDWNFFGELWHNKGDCEIYDNIFYGHGTLDIAGFDNDIIAGNTFSYKIYNNQFLNNSKIDPVQLGPSNYSHQYAITIEGTDHEYLYIYNNLIQRYGYGIEIATGSSTSSGIPARNFLHDHFYIYNNIFEDMGYATYTYSAPIMVINEVNDPGYTNTTSNWYIVNNTMTGGNRAYNGVRMTVIGTVSNINIKNNIIYDCASYAIYINKRTTDVTAISSSAFTYNDLYSNGNTTYINNGISGWETVDVSTGNIASNPLFISSTDFHLQASSPCVRTGTYIGSPVLTDYDGQGWLNPPSMGVYEIAGSGQPVVSTSPVINITETTAVSGGVITSDGGEAVTARGVCWDTSPFPQVTDSKTTDGTGTGTFTSTVTGLTNGQTYYLRAYATNSIGTAYGLERSFTTPIPTSSGVRFIEHNGVLIIHNGKFVKSD